MAKIKVTITEVNGNKAVQRTFENWKQADKHIKFAIDWFVKIGNAKIEIEQFNSTEK